jgi:plastocyanin/mono/diheme cytochrome c family protein
MCMEMNRRSAGLASLGAVTVTVVVMVALAAWGAVSWGVAIGLIAGVVLTLALLTIFFGRLNAVQKTGYASLLGVVLIALFIPLFWLNQNSSQAEFQSDTYTLNLKRGAALFGQYCATCHGGTGQGGRGPTLNGSYGDTPVSQLSDDDITRIISGGVPADLDPSKLGAQGLQMPSWSDLYGGPLTSDDISYLVALIRSSEPAYLKNSHISDMTNGFTYVYGQLTTQAQIDTFNQNCLEPSKDHTHCSKSSGYGPVVDMTDTNQVTMKIEDVAATVNASGYGFEYTNIQIKAGTTITWTNVSAAPHTVTGQGTSDAKFNTGSSILGAGSTGNGGTYTFTFTTPGTYDYYCTLHPLMVGQIIVVA